MASAFVMISCDYGQEKRVIDEMKSLIPVKQIEETVGVYDIIAKVESKTLDKVKETINTQIQKMDNVRSTLTLFVN
ncbi:MAG TPA: Lrp/AsnC ligand binding domain-containing protein [Candidatus Nitrosotalea sp.]|nr:Lrp/AsnC ligand binding domain-containing protein [Candidatus Nitrosotalea sp.]